jgi:hypothetical protein
MVIIVESVEISIVESAYPACSRKVLMQSN